MKRHPLQSAIDAVNTTGMAITMAAILVYPAAIAALCIARILD